MKRIAACVAAVALVSCGGGNGGESGRPPTTPSTPAPAPAPATNRAPQVTAMTVSPTFGIAQLSQFSYAASATDPDGDTLTFTWDVAGNERTGSSGQILFSNGGSGTFRVTVTDGRGGSASDSRSITVGTMTGTWRGNWAGFNFTTNLTQNGGTISGDYSDQDGPGRLDAAVANTIDTNGNIRLRYKQAAFGDFTFTGTMDSTGRRITGTVTAAGAANVPFVMTK